jgi:hypothetical protein
MLVSSVPPKLLLVHGDATARQHDLNTTIAEPPPLARHLADRDP